MKGDLYMDYDICANCMHVSVCKYSLKVRKMIEEIDNAVTDRFDFEEPDANIRMPGPITRCIAEYPLKLEARCELFKAKIVNPR